MNAIIRGTTPTIMFAFETIDPAAIVAAYITIKSITDLDTPIVQKDYSSATLGATSISWTLTQTESLQLTAGDTVNIYCDWLLDEGTRGRSQVATCRVYETGKDEVIS